jgi:hypothetical protein
MGLFTVDHDASITRAAQRVAAGSHIGGFAVSRRELYSHARQRPKAPLANTMNGIEHWLAVKARRIIVP